MKFYVSQIPFLRLLIPYILGIIAFRLAYNSLNFNTYTYALFMLFLAVLFSLLRFLPNIFRNVQTVLRNIFVFIIFFILGIYVSKINFTPAKNISVKSEFVFQIKDIVKDKKTLNAVVEIQYVKDTQAVFLKGKQAIVYLQKANDSLEFFPGDYIVCKGQIAEVKQAGIPYQFDYKQFLLNKGIAYAGYFKSNKHILHKNNKFNLKKYALIIRKKLLKTLDKFHFTSKQKAIISAISLGERKRLDNDLYSGFSNAGLMHILAVSGMHVGILFLILTILLKPFVKNKKTEKYVYLLLVIILWIYAFITGLSPSVIRAVLMFTLMIGGKILHKNYNIYNGIFASAFILLIVNPMYIFDLGFQLSYLAVLGILALQKQISALITPPNVVVKYIWDIFSISISAQLTTMGISLLYFHKFPSYFLLSNLAVAFLVSILFVSSFAYFLFSQIPFLNIIVYKILYYSSLSLIKIINFINNLPQVIVDNISWIYIDTILFYIIILFFIFYIYLKNNKLLYASLFSLAIFGAIYNYRLYKNKTEKTTYIVNLNGNIGVFHSSGQNTILSFNNKNAKLIKNINFSLKAFLINNNQEIKEILHSKNNFLDYETSYYQSGSFIKSFGKTFFRYRLSKVPKMKKPIKIDYLLIENYYGEKINDLFENIKCNTVIVGNNIKPIYKDILLSEIKKHEITFVNLTSDYKLIKL